MRRDLASELIASEQHLSLTVGGDTWNLYVFGVNRVNHDSFVQIALLGPRVCTVTVRADAAAAPGAKARQILEAIRGWLLSGDDRTHAFLETNESARFSSGARHPSTTC